MANNCPGCGFELPYETVRFCPGCGIRLDDNPGAEISVKVDGNAEQDVNVAGRDVHIHKQGSERKLETCQVCRGKGLVPYRVCCKKCGGSGLNPNTSSVSGCPDCVGAGYFRREQTCTTCDGTGKLYV